MNFCKIAHIKEVFSWFRFYQNSVKIIFLEIAKKYDLLLNQLTNKRAGT